MSALAGGRPPTPYGTYELVLYTLIIWIIVLACAVLWGSM